MLYRWRALSEFVTDPSNCPALFITFVAAKYIQEYISRRLKIISPILSYFSHKYSVNKKKRTACPFFFLFPCQSAQLSEWSCRFITSYWPVSWVGLVYGSRYWKVESLARTAFAFPFPFPCPNSVCYLVAALKAKLSLNWLETGAGVLLLHLCLPKASVQNNDYMFGLCTWIHFMVI